MRNSKLNEWTKQITTTDSVISTPRTNWPRRTKQRWNYTRFTSAINLQWIRWQKQTELQ